MIKVRGAIMEGDGLKVRAHVLICGFVQGVFFRHETRKRAFRQSLTGWVRNLPDGKVEAIFEGEKKDVDAMIDFCHRGPPGAVVRDIEVLWEEPKGEFKDFQILY